MHGVSSEESCKTALILSSPGEPSLTALLFAALSVSSSRQLTVKVLDLFIDVLLLLNFFLGKCAEGRQSVRMT